MGIPVSEPDYGEDCLACWAAGRTPRTAYAVFTGVPTCPYYPETVPNNVPLAMSQTVEDPCGWDTGPLTSWRASYATSETAAFLGLTYNPTGQCYYWQQAFGMCRSEFVDNSQSCVGECPYKDDCPAGQIYPTREGSGWTYFSSDQIPAILCETMGLHPGLDNLYEKIPAITDLATYRIANKLDKTNVLCRVCTTVIGRANELLEFTGVLSPDSTGDFEEVCTYNSQPYYRNAANSWLLWYNIALSNWTVSLILGTVGTQGWQSVSKISNSYIPYGTASGIGDMHAPA